MANGLVKIIRFDDRFPTTGEPTVQLLTQRDLANVKLASEAGDYIRTVEPKPGKTIVLVLAMSAGEYYGPNRNGDAFSEKPVPGAVGVGETLVDHYKTFESDAYVYRHHVNKDPAKSLGKVLKAFYNFEMHRVELLLELDNDLAHDIVERINNGEYPAVSMGCRIKYDVCSICGNKAPTRAQYCDHAKYEMNRVYPDGSKSFVWNPSPKLFDISFVLRPADRIGFMMKKVAHVEPAAELSADLGAKVAAIQEKLSTLKKLSDIDKIIRGQAVDHTPHNRAVATFARNALPKLLNNTPEFDQEAISTLAQHPLPEAMSTLGAMGITPTSAEMTDMMVQRAMPGQQMPEHVRNNIGAAQGDALELLRQHPEILEALEQAGLLRMSAADVNQELAQKLSSWVEKRSNFKEYIERRIFSEPHPDIGNWEVVTARDPNTGESYQTTRGSIDNADDANINRQLKTLAGAGLLSGAGYKVLTTGGLLAGQFALPAALSATNAAMNYSKTPTIEAEDDTPRVGDKYTREPWTAKVPINAEMRKSGSFAARVAVPAAFTAGTTALLAQDYNKKRNNGTLGQSASPLTQKMEVAGRLASEHPVPTFLAGLGGISLLSNSANKLQNFIKGAAADSVHMPEVDLEGLSYWLGDKLFRVGT